MMLEINRVTKLKNILIIFFALFIASCEVTQVKNANNIRSKIVLNKDISIPQKIRVAWYAGADELERVYKGSDGVGNWRFLTGPKMQSALDVVLPSYFEKPEKLTLNSKFDYLLKFSSTPSYSNGLGTYIVDLTLVVMDPTGAEIYKTTVQASDSYGVFNAEAFHNVYAKAIKDSLTNFLNEQGNEKLTSVKNASSDTAPQINFQEILGSLKPSSSATGFYINQDGQVLTAAHAIDGCMLIKIQQKGITDDATEVASSKILDVALLQSSAKPTQVAPFGSFFDEPSLGQPIFTTGYPLSAILSDYPSMTMGNISSLGGLKGAVGLFQFSAPIQPGNSGGPITDYKGNVLGLVTSTLNQAMMLDKTGTTAQNVNFGLNNIFINKFLLKNNIQTTHVNNNDTFENASKMAVDFTVQVLCYK